MSARNIHHAIVVEALKADGWTITDDPLSLNFGGRNKHIDLGLEKNTLAAEKGSKRIAVEIQSFLTQSVVRALQEAMGQYKMYSLILAERQPDRQLYMAVSSEVYDDIFLDPFGQCL